MRLLSILCEPDIKRLVGIYSPAAVVCLTTVPTNLGPKHTHKCHISAFTDHSQTITLHTPKASEPPHEVPHNPAQHPPHTPTPTLSGRSLAARAPVFSASGTPLAYMWPPGHHAEPYLGAAHGLIGIMYALLLLQQRAPQCMPDAQQDLADIRAALRYVIVRRLV